MFQVLSFCYRERAQPPLIKITVLTFLVIKGTVKHSVFLKIREKNRQKLVRPFSASNLKVSTKS